MGKGCCFVQGTFKSDSVAEQEASQEKLSVVGKLVSTRFWWKSIYSLSVGWEWAGQTFSKLSIFRLERGQKNLAALTVTEEMPSRTGDVSFLTWRKQQFSFHFISQEIFKELPRKIFIPM